MPTTTTTLNDLFNEEYSKHIAEHIKYMFSYKWTVEQWLENDITEEDTKNYINAAEAYKIKNSKLYKILK